MFKVRQESTLSDCYLKNTHILSLQRALEFQLFPFSIEHWIWTFGGSTCVSLGSKNHCRTLLPSSKNTHDLICQNLPLWQGVQKLFMFSCLFLQINKNRFFAFTKVHLPGQAFFIWPHLQLSPDCCFYQQPYEKRKKIHTLLYLSDTRNNKKRLLGFLYKSYLILGVELWIYFLISQIQCKKTANELMLQRILRKANRYQTTVSWQLISVW